MWWLTLALATPYDDARTQLERDRVRLAGLDRTRARERARARLLWAIREDLTPSWLGTPWNFHATSVEPGEGHIACGYFVSTVFLHAGLRVERVLLAQQASERIVKTFAEPDQIERFRGSREQAVVAHVREQPDGVYVVGFDYHVGLLVKRDTSVEFCHSSYLGEAVVTCSDPLRDPAFVSNYHVVGPAFSDRVVDAWLAGRAVPTHR